MKLFIFVFLPFTLFANISQLEMGKKIYFDTCISCHGKDGKAHTNIQLLVKPRNLNTSILNEEQSYKIIKKGAHYWGAKADIMPAFEFVYNEKQLKAVAYFISKTFHPNVEQEVQKLYDTSAIIKDSKKVKMLKRGEKIFKRNCSWCHGIDGKGNGEASRNPELSIFPYDLTKTLLSTKQMFLYAKYGGHYWGTHKEDMPSWSKKYDDFTLKAVIKYIDETLKESKE